MLEPSHRLEAIETATVSVPNAAKVLGISRASAYKAAKNGELPVIKLGKRVLVLRDGLQKMIAGGR
jgi:excisionase family DNA binding protein